MIAKTKKTNEVSAKAPPNRRETAAEPPRNRRRIAAELPPVCYKFVPLLRRFREYLRKDVAVLPQIWLPIETNLLIRYEFATLSAQTRYIFVGILLYCAARGIEEIPVDIKFLANALAVDERMLKKSLEELEICGLLVEREKERKKEQTDRQTTGAATDTADAPPNDVKAPPAQIGGGGGGGVVSSVRVEKNSKPAAENLSADNNNVSETADQSRSAGSSVDVPNVDFTDFDQARLKQSGAGESNVTKTSVGINDFNESTGAPASIARITSAAAEDLSPAPTFDAPKTNAPETNAATFDAPQTNAPETNAATFDAPQINAPTFDRRERAPAAKKNNKSQFTLDECRRYVEKEINGGAPINNAAALSIKLFQSGEADSFIKARLYPEKAAREQFGAPVAFTVAACRECFGAKMSNPDGRGYRACRRCKNERGASTGLEPETPPPPPLNTTGNTTENTFEKGENHTDEK